MQRLARAVQVLELLGGGRQLRLEAVLGGPRRGRGQGTEAEPSRIANSVHLQCLVLSLKRFVHLQLIFIFANRSEWGEQFENYWKI